MNQELISIAMKELGVLEAAGPANNERIMQYAEDAGFPDYTSDEIAWCSLFMNWVALEGNMERSRKLNARSWLNNGINVDDNPEPGDVVIYWRESPLSWKGHVGIYLGFSKDNERIYTLGGNQNNAVSISAYRANRLLGFRRLKPVKKIKLTTKVLKKGDRGPEVVALQEVLKLVGTNPGTADGIFGPKTEAALKVFQTTFADSNEEINGQLTRRTRKELLKVVENL